MGRAVSTVLDASLACLLVSASVALLVGVPSQPSAPPDADRVGRAYLPATVTTQVDGHRVRSSVASHLVAAAANGNWNETALAARLTALSRRAHVTVGSPADPALVAVGAEPPPAASAVDAAAFRVGGSPPVVVTVRTWSP